MNTDISNLQLAVIEACKALISARDDYIDAKDELLLAGGDLPREAIDPQEIETSNLKRRVVTDGRTKLLNNMAIDEHLKIAESNAVLGQRVAVMVIDLDKMKHVNDTQGHDAGNALLANTADLIRSVCRPDDQVGRYGGDEFVVVSPNTEARTAMKMAERIRSRVEKETQVTTSIGVATTLTQELGGTLFGRADKALYWSKNNGRNQVTLAYDLELEGDDAGAV